MKRLFLQLSFLFLLSLSLSAQSDGKAEISTTTIKFPGTYSAHCVVIWAQDANGKFIRTIKVQAQSRQSKLTNWTAVSKNNKVDAISGATLTSHGPHKVTWDLKDVNKQIVPDGNYEICIEGTQSNDLSLATMYKIPFTKGFIAQTKTIPDNANIKATKVVFSPVITNLDDLDNDGIANDKDNCPTTPNADQKDIDGDGKGDVCDNCPSLANSTQADGDGDQIGDVCDNCPSTANTDQKDSDGDKIGDLCDPDSDGDGFPNTTDNCPSTANADQSDRDKDGSGDVCDAFPDLNIRFIPGSTITYYAEGKNATTYDAAKNVYIDKATTPPVIDGKDDEPQWLETPFFEGQTLGKGSAEQYVSNNNDAQIKWKAIWDETALYIVIKIKDDVLVWNDALKGWNIDALEFYVTKDAIVNAETGNSLGRTTQAKVLWQNLYLASPAGRQIMEFRGSDNTTLQGMKTPVAGTSVKRSYDDATKTTTFEIRYEWTKILTGTNAFTSVAENDKIRIAMMFNDNDNPTVDARDHKVFYTEKVEPSANLSHKDWAVVTLNNTFDVGLNKLKAIDNFMLHPNPASGTVLFSKVIDADFYNLTGQKVLSVKNSSQADISSLTKGIYQVKVNNGQSYKLTVN